MFPTKRYPAGLLRFALAAILCAAPASAAEPEGKADVFREKALPLIQKYCFDCHGNGAAEGDFALDKFATAGQVRQGRRAWLKVVQKLQVEAMPPEGSEQPTSDERESLLEWIDTTINDIDCTRDARPGRVTVGRLNRAEYRNTVRDLLGVDYEPAESFPADDVGYGFDNIGDVLSLPPILLEKYLAAAEEVSEQALALRRSDAPIVLQRTGSEFEGGDANYPGQAKGLHSNGELKTSFEPPEAGRYELSIEAFGHQAGDEPVKMALRLGQRRVRDFLVFAEQSKAGTYSLTTTVDGGEQEIGLAFLNDYYKPRAEDPDERDRNLIVSRLEVRGPLEDASDSEAESHRRIFFVQPDGDTSFEEAARQTLEQLATRAYRRPVRDEELERLMQLVEFAREGGDNFEQSVQLALQAILASPHFLFRVEKDPPPGESERTLNDYELATRLSYFLWSSMPDEELFEQARQGTLHEPDNLQRQVRRMLQDSKAQALVDNFASQWLQLRKFDEVTPSDRFFPGFDEQLRRDMRRETERFFAHVVQQDRSILDLIGADYTFVNERLARHYGIVDVRGEQFQRVSLDGLPRRGVLTQGTVLTVTSNPTRTSPVKRGKWILDNLLGEPPPPPPPDVPELPEDSEKLSGTLREQLEQHRENPSCAVCHREMDALGFALENFDAVGGWRRFDGQYEIDPAGELPDGSEFDGPRELIDVLVQAKKDQFVRCFSEKLLTYALGRGLEYYDQCAVDRIVDQLSGRDYRFSALVLSIVESEPFQKRGAPTDES